MFFYNSDPTYEAWKPRELKRYIRTLADSDPTYEAWKLPNDSDTWQTIRLTPILPMRHGNKAVLETEKGLLFTPILPMRHGNRSMPTNLILL